MCSYVSNRAESVYYCVAILCMIGEVLSFFHSGRITGVLVRIVRLDHNTEHPKWKMLHEFQKYALHVSVVIVFIFGSSKT